MKETSDLAGLLAVVESVLRTKVIAQCEGDVRFAGLMAASAMGMAQRALELSGQSLNAARDVAELVPKPNPFASDGEALTHLIRAGALDGAEDAYRRLLADAAVRTAVTRPAILSASEQRLAGLEEAP
jgi:hypothetical protein